MEQNRLNIPAHSFMEINNNNNEKKTNRYTINVEKNLISFTGFIDDEHPQTYLDPFFYKFIETMGDEATLDIRNLRFINSSGIKSFVNFILKRKPDSKIIILSSAEERWQTACLDLLQNLDYENITIKRF